MGCIDESPFPLSEGDPYLSYRQKERSKGGLSRRRTARRGESSAVFERRSIGRRSRRRESLLVKPENIVIYDQKQ